MQGNMKFQCDTLTMQLKLDASEERSTCVNVVPAARAHSLRADAISGSFGQDLMTCLPLLDFGFRP